MSRKQPRKLSLEHFHTSLACLLLSYLDLPQRQFDEVERGRAFAEVPPLPGEALARCHSCMHQCLCKMLLSSRPLKRIVGRRAGANCFANSPA